MGVEARLLDDRADASERRGTLGGQVAAEQRACGPAVGSASPSSSRISVVLPAPLAPEEAEGGAARDLEVDALERISRPEPLAKTLGLDGEGRGFDERC